MRFRSFFLILILVMALVDLYAFQAVRTLMHHRPVRIRSLVYGLFWFCSLGSVVLILLFPLIHEGRLNRILLTLVLGFFIGELIVSVFLLIDDLRRAAEWAGRMILSPRGKVPASPAKGISRSSFLSSLGLLLGGSFLGVLIYGFSNKYNYQIRRVRLNFPNLPEGFRGLRILQISDIHSGSFDNPGKVARGVDMALAEKADIIFFTGDLVNNRYEEMKDYTPIFSRLQAPMGIYSTLGNHDYGDYMHWPSPGDKAEHLEKLKELEASMGWHMLNNAHTILERQGQQIALIGVENWSAFKRFPRHGDLKKAYQGTEKYPFKILLSHDPSHWDTQVRPEFPDIDLTLSGHTHGFQFGIQIPGWQWSPAEYFYKEWDGLYRDGRQVLYVNPGYGFIGYPGRVGILPEITVFELN